jgi:hypothetical protein
MSSFEQKKCYVKVYGERNVGTNYLEKLLAENFIVQPLRGNHGKISTYMAALGRQSPEAEFYYDLEMRRILASDFGWKHSVPPVEQIERAEHAPYTLFLVLTKHPIYWLRSLHRRPYRQVAKNVSFDDFTRAPFPISQADGISAPGPLSPVEILRFKTEGYIRLAALPVASICVPYESLLSEFQSQMDRIAPHLIQSQNGYSNIERGVKDNRESLTFYKSKYDLSKATDDVSAETLAYVKENLGEKCLSYLGYTL